ncbi:MAG: hypothetical protein JSV65_12920 [Armatimonadota bacterium]|nr:MAG: hypothetical protein JSV65_12920 [Armatimonadota bacterium]
MQRVSGKARVDARTKRLALRLQPGDIAVISHRDLDGSCASDLIARGVGAVVNAQSSITGKYPNLGPQALLNAGISVIDQAGDDIMELVREGDVIELRGADVLRNGAVICSGQLLTQASVAERMHDARANVDHELRSFVENTLSYIGAEQGLLAEPGHIPDLNTSISGRHVLVVVRGQGAREDLRIIRSFIRDMKPVLIGVDGGADVLLEAGYRPHLIVGDMDSISDRGLRCGAELVLHAYPDGRAPGLERLRAQGLSPRVFPSIGTSEDVALLLAYEKGAELIIAVGTHFSLVDFLDKARGGMASTFLTRLKVGSILVDAKGVSRLYRGAPSPAYLVAMVTVAAITIAMILFFAPEVRAYLEALWAKIGLLLTR